MTLERQGSQLFLAIKFKVLSRSKKAILQVLAQTIFAPKGRSQKHFKIAGVHNLSQYNIEMLCIFNNPGFCPCFLLNFLFCPGFLTVLGKFQAISGPGQIQFICPGFQVALGTLERVTVVRVSYMVSWTLVRSGIGVGGRSYFDRCIMSIQTCVLETSRICTWCPKMFVT